MLGSLLGWSFIAPRRLGKGTIELVSDCSICVGAVHSSGLTFVVAAIAATESLT